MRNYIESMIIGMIIVIVLGVIALPEYMILTNKNTYKVTVTEKQIKRNGEKDAYLIYTTIDGQTRVFENTDTLFYGKYNSSDVYAQIKPGKKYKFEVYGYRVPFMSWYENIISVKGE